MFVTAQQTQKILTGDLTFTQLGFSMMITRLKGVYTKDSTQLTLQKCTEEINSFLGRYRIIMGKDLEAISKL